MGRIWVAEVLVGDKSVGNSWESSGTLLHLKSVSTLPGNEYGPWCLLCYSAGTEPSFHYPSCGPVWRLFGCTTHS